MSKQENKIMIDSDGSEVPSKYISAYDKKRDKIVRQIFARYKTARTKLEAVMRETIDDLAELQAAREKETGVTLADKGNFSASSFDSSMTVELKQNYRIFLDERVVEAQKIMRKYAESLIKEFAGNDAAREILRQLVSEAFQANQSGALPTGKILSLLRYEIKDSEWERAKKLLQSAIAPQKGKRYISVGSRLSRQHDYEYIRLDAADCWPVEEVVDKQNEDGDTEK